MTQHMTHRKTASSQSTSQMRAVRPHNETSGDAEIEAEVAQFRAAKLAAKAEAAAQAAQAARASDPTAVMSALVAQVEKLTQKLDVLTTERAAQAAPRRGRPPGPAKVRRNASDKSEFFLVQNSEDYDDTALEDIRALVQLLGAVRAADVVDHKIVNHLGNPVTPSNARRWLNKLVARGEAVVGPEYPEHLNGEGWRFVWAKDQKALQDAIAGKIPTPTDARYTAK